jgi:hypothetical protein
VSILSVRATVKTSRRAASGSGEDEERGTAADLAGNEGIDIDITTLHFYREHEREGNICAAKKKKSM